MFPKFQLSGSSDKGKTKNGFFTMVMCRNRCGRMHCRHKRMPWNRETVQLIEQTGMVVDPRRSSENGILKWENWRKLILNLGWLHGGLGRNMVGWFTLSAVSRYHKLVNTCIRGDSPILTCAPVPGSTRKSCVPKMIASLASHGPGLFIFWFPDLSSWARDHHPLDLLTLETSPTPVRTELKRS